MVSRSRRCQTTHSNISSEKQGLDSSRQVILKFKKKTSSVLNSQVKS